jgi:hypothetical protein
VEGDCWGGSTGACIIEEMDKLLVDGGAAWKGWDCWSETAVVGGYMEASLEVDEIGFSSLRRWADSRSSLERVGEVV